MRRPQHSDRVERGLADLLRVKADFVRASERAAREIRSCEGCDARCCKVDRNSMRISRIEALALARRLREPDLAPLIPGILAKAHLEIEERGLDEDPEATYDCPLLDEHDRCLAHGPAQPAGCLTFRPVADGGCDHDLPFFRKHLPRIRAAEKRALGKVYPPLSIPVALAKVLRPSPRSPGRRGGPSGDRRDSRSPPRRG